MTIRISLIVPLILIASSILSSILVYVDSKKEAEENIHKEVLSSVKLDVSRLQNILYNLLTERKDGLIDARLNLSVTAMDPLIKSLFLIDENNKIILANRYALEGATITKIIKSFDQFVAQKIKHQNTPYIGFLKDNKNILHGYYPITLNLEDASGLPSKKVGVLFMEVNIKTKLAIAFNEAANRAVKFSVIMLIAAILVAVLLHKIISQRLSILSKASKLLAVGKLDAQVNLQGRDEIAQLGKTFDEMALQIKEDINLQKIAAKKLSAFNEELEKRVLERTALLSDAQSIVHIGNWSWDVASGKIEWSDEIFKIFGYKPNEFVPSYDRFISTIHPHDVDEVKKSVKNALDKGDEYKIDHRILLPNSEERWVHERARVKIDEQGNTIGLSGTIQDITERKLIENNLRETKNEAVRLSETKSDFLSQMSHELRTPMNAILGFSQLLNMQSLSEKQHSFVDEIDVAGKHLLALISDLLDLSHIEAGRTLVVLEKINLRDVISEAAKITESLILENESSLNLNCDSDYKVIADVIRLRQVLVNLLSNAAKYNKKGNEIKVTCSIHEENIKVSVIDKGIGIDSKMMHKLFLPFERVGAEYTGIDGSGIGLTLSKQLIELMHGKIGVESTLGQGSTFWIEIPIAKQRNVNVENININNEGNICNILYIEDNIPNMRVIEEMLGYFDQIKLMSAHSGNYGIELAKEYKPDVILLDINLPDINGYQVLNVLRDNDYTKDIPVIAISVDSMPLDIENGLDAGFDDYLLKPIELDRLVSALNKFGNCRRLVSRSG